jgi:quercetin dioxygenase-like cupin family protein
MAMLKKALFALLGAAAFAAVLPARAHDVPGGHAPAEAGKEARAILQQLGLPDAAGRNGTMLTVSYSPGQASLPHVHPGSVFAYVLEGEVESQMEGEQPMRYKAGQYWYESPRHPHVVSRNVSDTQPARLLVWLMTGEGEEIALPYKK